MFLYSKANVHGFWMVLFISFSDKGKNGYLYLFKNANQLNIPVLRLLRIFDQTQANVAFS
jgi:hypothetical protein